MGIDSGNQAGNSLTRILRKNQEKGHGNEKRSIKVNEFIRVFFFFLFRTIYKIYFSIFILKSAWSSRVKAPNSERARAVQKAYRHVVILLLSFNTRNGMR